MATARTSTSPWPGPEGLPPPLAWSGPVAHLDQLSYCPVQRDRVAALAAQGLTAAMIAEEINAEGLRPPKRVDHCTADAMREPMHRLGQPQGCPSRPRRWGSRPCPSSDLTSCRQPAEERNPRGVSP
jgi:hypothetical protein